MRFPIFIAALAVLAGCAATGPPPASTPASPPDQPASPLGSPFAERPAGRARIWPLVLDRSDMSLGTSVCFNRVPTYGELHDLVLVKGVQHLVISLPSWPTGVQAIETLQQIPEEADAIVILLGYPPTREAAEAWNILGARVRIIAYVNGPPTSVAMLDDLNLMRGLERVIAEMDEPERGGFERLQRPLSFRKVIE